MCHERLTSFETPARRAAFQLKQVTRQLSVRPLAVYDRGYGNASFVNQTAEIEADLLLRLGLPDNRYQSGESLEAAIKRAGAVGSKLPAGNSTDPLAPDTE